VTAVPGQTTHHVEIGPDTVTKTYVSWDRGEPDREWDGLTLLAEHAPGLAPVPLSRGLRAGAPAVVMSRLPGVGFHPGPLSAVETLALGAALRRLYGVPAAVLTGLPERVWGPSACLGLLRGWADEPHDAPPEAAAALAAARSWLADPARDRRAAVEDPVLGLADGNLANVLFDGTSCRLVDFEDSGVSDPAYEVADLLEHVSVRLPRVLDPEALVRAVGLTDTQVRRCAEYRTRFAVFWLLMLLPDGRAHHRNPPGALADQAAHLQHLLTGTRGHGPGG
jgi:aminoglycoside phosphotransferase (APT) family kinase protein